MLLSQLLKNQIEKKKLNFNKFNPDIKGIHFNSSKISKNFIFVAIDGKKKDGHKYIDNAISNGAALIVIEKKSYKKKLIKKKINFVYTESSKIFLSKLSSRFYINQPKYISAVTGTNGKTSVSFMAKEIWKNCNIDSASIGTLGVITNKYKKKLELTTENSVEFHKNLSILYKKKINYVCCEASSHGLEQNRIDSLKLDLAAFTNISQDHFDYHKNYKNYFNSKMRLFLKILKKNGIAIINSDLPESKKILDLCKKNKIKTFTYGYNSNDFKIITFYQDRDHQKIIIKHKKDLYEYKLPMLGDFQVYNSICAICIVYFSGVPLKKCFKAVEKIRQVPGRLEMINVSNDMKKKKNLIFIDYAHTPDAIEKSLKALKRISSKISIVFGCGGERDKKKRPLMGRIARKYADKIYVTDDNPRHESAKKIRKEIISNCPGAIEIKNRRLAIKKAIYSCDQGETVLIAGKGHEDYQIIGDKFYKFSDKEIILKILKRI